MTQRASIRFTRLALTTLVALFGCDPNLMNSAEDGVTIIGGRGGAQEAGVMVRPPSADMMVEDMWITEEGPTLNSILPTRANRRGGATIRVIGANFREPMDVRIGGEPCLTLTVESVSRMSCELPPWPSAARVDVSVAWLEESSPRVLPEALTYYDELRLNALSPAEGPTQGNTEVTLTGEGFEEPTDVRFGGLPALSVELIDAQTIVAITPPSPARLGDVSVQNANGRSTLEGAFRWRGPIGVERISPSWAWSTGAERVDLIGYGLLEGSQVTITGEDQSGGRARVTMSDAPVSLTIETPGVSPGWASVKVENGNGDWETERGLLFLDPTPGPFSVLGLSPERLPSDEGGYFMIGGNGFTEETTVRVGGSEASCELEAPQRLRCFTPSRSPGRVEVTVSQWVEGAVSTERLSLEFYVKLDLFELSPPRASTAGGGLIKLTGRGFSDALRLSFNGLEVELVSVPSSEELWLRAPAHPAGLIDLSVTRPLGGSEERAFLPDALTYFDPISRYGGPWGPVIEHALNVTALDIYDLSPIEGVRVELRPFDAPTVPPQLVGVTPADGRVTLSAEGLEGPVDVTALKEGYEVVTTERVVSENLTIIMIPMEPPPEGEGAPPEPPEPARVSGQLVGLSVLPKPIEPGYTLMGFVDVSHSDMLSRAFNSPPAPTGILTEDGPFELEVEPRQMSLIGTAAYVQNWALDSFNRGQLNYWGMRRYSRPIAMGLVRFLSLTPGANIEEVTLNLSYPTREQALVHHINPGRAAEELNNAGEVIPQRYETRAFLNLGPDGYWELDVAQEGEELELRVVDLPDMEALPADVGLEWYGTALLNENTTTETFHTQRDISQEVKIGPYVEAPYLTSHGPGGMVRIGDTISWSVWPGVERTAVEPAEVFYVRLIQDGFPAWSYLLPGGTRSFTLPAIGEGVSGVGLHEGGVMLQLRAMSRYGEFDYQDFNLLDIFNPISETIYNHQLYFTELPPEP